WGVARLSQELRLRDIHPRLITSALSEINEQEYASTFEKIASQKIKSVGGVDTQAKKAKVYNYLISKGYAPDMIWGVLNVK
ncbi:MAG: RecX family transcriptional regulator, partial [Flavobacteriales bacterium]|nr:RecX family transcriptional regulator [Flavobacteriales bacterium]